MIFLLRPVGYIKSRGSVVTRITNKLDQHFVALYLKSIFSGSSIVTITLPLYLFYGKCIAISKVGHCFHHLVIRS